MNGPTIKGLLSNTEIWNELECILPEEFSILTKHLKNLWKINKIATSKVLDIDEAKDVLKELSEDFKDMKTKLELSQSLKMQFIMDHLEDYFELSGRTLLVGSDETVVATHSKIWIFEEWHGYKINHKETPKQKNKQHKSSVHFNSLN